VKLNDKRPEMPRGVAVGVRGMWVDDKGVDWMVGVAGEAIWTWSGLFRRKRQREAQACCSSQR
jgi:hypothetical protein